MEWQTATLVFLPISNLLLCFIYSMYSVDYFCSKYGLKYPDVVRYFQMKNDLFAIIGRRFIENHNPEIDPASFSGTPQGRLVRIVFGILFLYAGASYVQLSFRLFHRNKSSQTIYKRCNLNKPFR